VQRLDLDEHSVNSDSDDMKCKLEFLSFKQLRTLYGSPFMRIHVCSFLQTGFATLKIAKALLLTGFSQHKLHWNKMSYLL
jgi:hypothetical protein